MSEWLLSERQSICVCRDRMSAPMPCVLLTQCYGFFILSNQWYMKRHRHISTIDLFFYSPLHTYQRSVWFLVIQLLWCSGLNKQFTFFFFVAFSFGCLDSGRIQYRWKTSNKQCTKSDPNKWNTCLLSVDLLNSGGSGTGAAVLAIVLKKERKTTTAI